MDKVSVNQQIVLMRNVVKNARRHTYLTLRNKAINYEKTIKEIPKNEEGRKKKVEDSLRKVKENLALIKFICVDTVSKEALKATEPWIKILENPKTSREQKLIARIANSGIVQKHVKKFRDEHKDWELYLNTLLELWDEKKKIKQNISTEEKNFDHKDNQIMERFTSKTKSNKSNESPSKPAKDKEKKMKSAKKEKPIENKNRILFATESKTVEKESNESLGTKTESKCEAKEAVQSNDDFFINKKSLFPNVESTNQSEAVSQKNFKPKFKNPKNEGNSGNHKKSWKQHKDNRNDNETVHPSWEAKKKQKQLFKIDINNSQAKKIRFTD